MRNQKHALAESDLNQLPAFSGFPYLITRIAPAFYHINLLPLDERYSFYRLREIARRQVDSNRLRACLVLDENRALFLEPWGKEWPSSDIPRGGRIVFGRLVLCEPLPETDDLSFRQELLELFASALNREDGRTFILGDLTKGGRRPTEEESQRLGGRQDNGVPAGLVQCRDCGEWRGDCFDTLNSDLVVRVGCRCANDTRCAGCGCKFGDRRLESNYYSEDDRTIWHVPAFAALEHCCSIKR